MAFNIAIIIAFDIAIIFRSLIDKQTFMFSKCYRKLMIEDFN